MTWFYATSVSVTNGATVVSVNAGDDIAIIQPGDGLVIGTQPPVEVKRTYLDGSSNKKIELLKPWPYGSQTNQAAVAFPTDGDLAAATAVLKQLIDGFTLATQAEAQAGTENTKPMTALRVKQAMDALLGSASKLAATTSVTDSNVGRAMRVGDHGLGGRSPQKNNWASMGAFTQFVTMATPENAPDDINSTGNWWHIIRMQSDNTPAGALALKTHFSGGFPMAYPELWLQNADPSSLGYKARVYSNRNALGTVAFSGGVNTGAIIERGINSNGEYAKFADGTMICNFTRTAALGMSSFSGGIYVGDFIWQFPAAFATSQPVTISGTHGDSASRGWLSSSSLSATQALINCYSVAASNTSTYTTVVAFGRWR